MATIEEWIKRYNAKVPWPFERDNRFELWYRPDKGICELGVDGDMVTINQMSGDGRFWKHAADTLARTLGLTKAGTQCLRKNIRAYVRLFGFRIDHEEPLPDGKVRLFCIDKITGKSGLVSPTPWGTHFITWEP